MADLKFALGEIQRLEAENKRLWKAIDELMRDQTKSDKKTEKLEKRVTIIEAWLAAEDEKPKLLPPATRSVG